MTNNHQETNQWFVLLSFSIYYILWLVLIIDNHRWGEDHVWTFKLANVNPGDITFS